MPAKMPAQLEERQRRRSYEFKRRGPPAIHLILQTSLQSLAHFARMPVSFLLIMPPDNEIDQAVKGRVVIVRARRNFAGIKCRKIMPAREANTRMFRRVRLNDHAPRFIAPSRPARNLSQQLERALGRTEIRQHQTDIRGNDPHKRDMRKIKSFGDHLRADQNIRIAAPENFQNLLVRTAFAYAIGIQP